MSSAHLARLLRCLCITSLVVTPLACKSGSSATTDGGGNPGSTDAGTRGDGGDVDAGEPGCHSHDDCLTGQYCLFATHECIQGKLCQGDSSDPTGNNSCELQPDPVNDDYCANGQCYCDLTRAGGTCLPRIYACQPCTDSKQCGNTNEGIYLDYLADCKALPGDASGLKYCLPTLATTNSCTLPHGFKVGDAPGYESSCVPNSGSCNLTVCNSDNECDPQSGKPECNTTVGSCRPACEYNYQKGTSFDCGDGQVCHVDPRLLQPGNNPNFGLGKCGPPCDSGATPFECGPSMQCVPDGDPATVPARTKRCRPPLPQCIRDQDCPQSPATHSYGYCQRDTLTCSTGCSKSSQCASGYGCQDGNCVPKTCIEEGGAIIGCDLGQFCCGEANSPPCPAAVRSGQCYPAPNPPWCTDCAEGDSVPTPAGSTRPKPSICAAGKMWHSCDPALKGQCPRGYNGSCSDGPFFCKTDADCGSGGKCADIKFHDQDAKACACDQGQTCPTATSKCLKDDKGKGTICSDKWCDMTACYPPQ